MYYAFVIRRLNRARVKLMSRHFSRPKSDLLLLDQRAPNVTSGEDGDHDFARREFLKRTGSGLVLVGLANVVGATSLGLSITGNRNKPSAKPPASPRQTVAPPTPEPTPTP